MSLPAKNVSDYWALPLAILFQCLHCSTIMSSAACLPGCKSCEFQLLLFNKFPNLFVPPHPDLHNCDVNISIYFRVLLWWRNNWCTQSKYRTNVKYSINVSLISSDSESPIILLQFTHWAWSLTPPVCKLCSFPSGPMFTSNKPCCVFLLVCSSPSLGLSLVLSLLDQSSWKNTSFPYFYIYSVFHRGKIYKYL